MESIQTNLTNHSATIHWGIIGCGNVTELKSGPAFNKVPNAALMAVMRRDAVKAKDYATRHGVPKWYSNANELINDPVINAVYIATPPKFHEAYAIAALQAGKNVYVEKPMSTDLASCKRMQKEANNTGGKLCIAHYRRALPMFLAVKKLLAENTIGTIRAVAITLLQPDKSAQMDNPEKNWRVDPALAGGGLFYDLAPHQLDLVFYFFGKALAIQGFSVNQAGLYSAEDIVTGNMILSNRILFSGLWSFTVSASLYKDDFEIIGSAGKISFPVFGNEITVETDGGKEVLTFKHPTHIQQPMIEKIVDYFLNKGNNPCSAADAIQSMTAMEQFVYGNGKTTGSL